MPRKKTFKSQKPKVHRFGDWGIMEFADHSYSFDCGSTMMIAPTSILPLASRNAWEQLPFQYGDIKVIPNGSTNQLPHDLRDILEDNNLPEGILKKQRNLLWGQGPHLYQEQIVDNKVVRNWVEDAEVESWLRSFDYEEYLRKTIVDYNHMEGIYAKIFLNRGSMLPGGKSFIAKVEHAAYHRCRLEWPEDGVNWLKIIEGDWYNPNIFGLTPYTKFDPSDPFRSPVSMMFCNLNSFARNFYGLPTYYGALAWIQRGSSIPKILEALTKNSLNIKWHIKSPASYWAQKKSILEDKCARTDQPYKDSMLEDLKDDIFKQLADVLSGEKNVGKFFESETMLTETGNEEGWKIEPIDQKTKDFIESQILIAQHADSAITSGMGLHPSLSNIMVDGKLASGSEQLYAYKIYMATEVNIPESIICKPLNTAINVNWPDKRLKIGFYHDILVMTEAATPPKERVKNAV